MFISHIEAITEVIYPKVSGYDVSSAPDTVYAGFNPSNIAEI